MNSFHLPSFFSSSSALLVRSPPSSAAGGLQHPFMEPVHELPLAMGLWD